MPPPTGAAPVSIHGAGPDHRLYVLFAVATHATIGCALVAWTTGGPGPW